MRIENPRIVTCTQKTGSLVENTDIFKSIKHLNLDLKTIIYEANTLPLSQQYNMAIDEALRDNVDCLILVHDDVTLEEDPLVKLEKLFDQFDLVGVAGASKIELVSPALWHLMGGGFNSGNLHGCVQHVYWDNNSWEYKKPASNFGPYPHRVVMIDGVFMALNRKVMETIRFDESNPCGFHFYDLQVSMDTHLSGLKVGVGDILITHASPGLREFTKDWLEGEKWFLNKYDN